MVGEWPSVWVRLANQWLYACRYCCAQRDKILSSRCHIG